MASIAAVAPSLNSDNIDWPLSRRLVATIMEASAPWLVLFGGDLDLAAVWQTIRLVNLSSPASPARLRPVPMLSVSAALGRPTTTTNARVASLIADGLCSRGRGGLSFRIPSARADAFTAASANTVAVFNRLIAAMAAEHAGGDTAHAIGTLEAMAARLDAMPPLLLETHYVNYAMRVVATLAIENEAPGIDALIFNTIIGVRPPGVEQQMALSYNPVPMTVRNLATRLDLPPETVRRRVKALVARQMLIVGKGGVTVPEPARQGEQIEIGARNIITSFYQMQRNLCAALLPIPPQ